MSDFKRRDFPEDHRRRRRRHRAGRRSALWSRTRTRSMDKMTPEKGAKLRVLRWKRFVQGDEDVWAAEHRRSSPR